MRVTIKVEKANTKVEYNNINYIVVYNIFIDDKQYAMLIHTAKNEQDDNNLIFAEVNNDYNNDYNIVSDKLDEQLGDIMHTYESLYKLKNEYISEFDYELV